MLRHDREREIVPIAARVACLQVVGTSGKNRRPFTTYRELLGAQVPPHGKRRCELLVDGMGLFV